MTKSISAFCRDLPFFPSWTRQKADLLRKNNKKTLVDHWCAFVLGRGTYTGVQKGHNTNEKHLLR